MSLTICIAAIAGTAFYAMLAWSVFGKPISAGLAGIARLPKSTQAILLVCALVATVEAQKGSGTNDPPRRAINQTNGNAVSPEDIARGYSLVDECEDEGHSYAAPSNATVVGNWHVHGASSPFGGKRVDFGEWSFPLGPGNERHSSAWVFPDARLRTSPHDALREIRAADMQLFAAPGESRLWTLFDENGTRIITWERFFAGTSDTNTPVYAQLSLHGNGDFQTRSNDVARSYRRINPHDWDGDGLANDIDPAPTECGGDLFGTSVAWYNANCSGVLSAEAGTNGTAAISWNDGVHSGAYYWLDFVSTAADNMVEITCDGPSDLGDMTVIAASNQLCRIPLLVGAIYTVSADYALEDVYASNPNAEVNQLGDDGRSLCVELPLPFCVSQNPPQIAFSTTPYDIGATITAATNGCCLANFDVGTLTWSCDSECECSGFGHRFSILATWEGYSKWFDADLSCTCQEYNRTHPEKWISISAPSVLMKGGNAHSVVGVFSPPCETNAVVSLSCISGVGKFNVLESGELRQTIQGVAKSEEPGDVAFEMRLDLDGCVYAVTQALTVAKVRCMHMSSVASCEHANPPPFPGESPCPFSSTNSPSPDMHLQIPFYHVANRNDFSVNDFMVNMRLELDPDIPAPSGMNAEWTILENTIDSGAFTSLGGLAARFSNPKRGGVLRVGASFDGSPTTEGNLLLPLAGAAVDAVFRNDFLVADEAARNFTMSWCRYAITPFWGAYWFYVNGSGDYLGRADSSTKPTVWAYNQISDETFMGEVVTLHGIPIRLSKLSDFLVSYTMASVDIGEACFTMAFWIGTDDGLSAQLAREAGEYVATNGHFQSATAAMTTNGWFENDIKVQRLWPNYEPADNHRPRSEIHNFNFEFCSPGFVDELRPQSNTP